MLYCKKYKYYMNYRSSGYGMVLLVTSFTYCASILKGMNLEMSKKISLLEHRRNSLINDYRRADKADKVKLLIKIMDVEEEMHLYNSFAPKKQIL